MDVGGKFHMSRPSVIKTTVADNLHKDTIIKEATVAVRSLYDSRLVYVGTTSGKSYEWKRPGDTVMVLAEDVSELLAKRIGERACCGAVQTGNKVFELA